MIKKWFGSLKCRPADRFLTNILICFFIKMAPRTQGFVRYSGRTVLCASIFLKTGDAKNDSALQKSPSKKNRDKEKRGQGTRSSTASTAVLVWNNWAGLCSVSNLRVDRGYLVPPSAVPRYARQHLDCSIKLVITPRNTQSVVRRAKIIS